MIYHVIYLFTMSNPLFHDMKHLIYYDIMK